MKRSAPTIPIEAKFVREKIKQIEVEYELVKLESLLKIQSDLLNNADLDGFAERMYNAAILHESIVSRAHELLILVQDNDIVKD